MKFQHVIALLSVIAVSMAFVQYVPATSATSEASWTFMVYLDADNNLDWFGQYNLEQMRVGLTEDAAVNVIVLMDRLDLPAFTYEVAHGRTKIIQTLDEKDMGDPETLTSFVAFAMQNYPADYFFLDLWDHGGGYRGICWDDSSGNHLSPHDVETAIASAEAIVGGQRVDVVGFDACLMGMVEVCYELRKVTDIVVGSEMLVPGYGWSYAELMAYLSDNPSVDPRTLCVELVDEYVASYPHYQVQLSAVDEILFSDFVQSLDGLADALKADVDVYQNVIAGARGSAQQKFILGTAGAYYYVDVCKFAQLVSKRIGSAEIKALCADVVGDLDAAVFVDMQAKVGNLGSKQFGLTINFPPNGQKYRVNYEAFVPCFVGETSWVSFLMAYYDAM